MSALDLTAGVLAGGGAGTLATLTLLRYADTKPVGWLIGVRAAKTAPPPENDDVPPAATGSAVPPLGSHRWCTAGRRAANGMSPRFGRAEPTRRYHARRSDPVPLTPADQEAVAGEMRRHAAAMQQQVSAYADLLAGDDEVLRARLRRLEQGGE